MLFFFGFERLAWEGHGFLHPWFSFLPMSSCDEVFSSIPLALVRCFFFLYFRWIILLNIFIRINTAFSLSIGSGYTIGIPNRLFINNKIIGVVSFLVFLL